jgi:hypothetical protein
MKKIANIDEALAYVRRLGFTPDGTIHHQQICLYALCEALEQAAGGYPYQIRFHRYVSAQGISFPWLGKFTVKGARGAVMIEAKTVRS